MAKLLESQAGGKPTVVFDAAKQGPWTFSELPAGEISLLYSQTITYQSNVWLAISATDNMHDKEKDVIKKFNSLIKENPEPFFRTEPMAKIALVWPQRSGNYYSGSSIPLTDFTKESKTEKAGNTEEEFYGFYDGLTRSHFPFDVIDEESLTGNLWRYNLIVLPNVACLSKDEEESLRNYVKNGGNLVSTFETSLFDEAGNKRGNFGLADVFGIVSSGDIFGPLNWDYVAPSDISHFSLKEIKNRFLYSPTYGIKIKSPATSPVMFCKPLPGSYSGSPELTEFPFITENIFGKGRSIYLAGTFGGSLKKFHFPEYYQVLENITEKYAGRIVKLKNAPSSIEVNIRRKRNSVYIYLINFTSEMRRPIQKIISCNNIEINLSMKEKATSIRTLISKENLNFKTENGSVSFTVPALDDYEVIRIDS
ncbi:MAG: beta-galactosidase trimerization domain-containing protein [Bacteroidetes bacterium]|nr:beta-galactosidase trimerization domain-containing protein [Bacteroidota bacterium]